MPKRYGKIRDECAKGAKKDSPKYNQCQSKAEAVENSLRKKEGKRPMGRSR